MQRPVRRRFRIASEYVRSRIPARREGREHARVVILCGFPRSGTSLLFNMMAATLDGFAYEKRESSFTRTIWAAGNWLSKTPADILRITTIPRLNFYDKRCDVLVVVRDVRDVITSIHPGYPDRYYVSYETRHNPDFRGPRDSGIGPAYDAMKVFRAKKPDYCVLSFVRYEDLVSDPDGMQRLVAEQHSLPFSSPFSEFERHRDRLVYAFEGEGSSRLEDKPAVTSRVGRWRDERHRQRVREQFERHPELFAMLTEFGYEKDRQWFDV
jgi:hypothetical protein